MPDDGKFQELGLAGLAPHPPQGAPIRLDVVFVNGFGVQSVNNWRSLWPLNGAVGMTTEGGHIRAFTFTYYEAPVRPYREEELTILSEKLLSQLDSQRKNLRDRFRPLVFIGHSVGGIIVKKALLCAQLNAQFREILSSTLGVIFFATPHCSSPNGGSWLEIASNIFEASPLNFLSSLSSGKFTPQPSVLMTEEDSAGLENISRGFAQIQKLRLVNFVEGENLLLDKLIVPRGSAKLVAPNSQILEVDSEGSHFEVCKSIGTDNRHGFKQLIHEMEHNSPKASKIQSWIQQTDVLLSLGVAEICQENDLIYPVKGTCAWIQERELFKEWYTGAKRLLWVRGNMGCGKTYLSKHIRGILSREPKKQFEDILAYCSLDQIGERHKTPKSVLLCLLQDILIARRNQVQEFLTGEEDIRDRPFSFVARRWKDVVDRATDPGRRTRLTLVIDGIDQLVDHEELGSFYECITAAGRSGGARVLILSRPHGDLAYFHERQGFSVYDLSSEDSQVDIERVVDQRLKAFARGRTYDDDLEHHLGQQIKGKAFGMWRWADLALSEVSSGELSKDPESLRRLELPPGMVTLYDLILKRLLRSKHPDKFPQHVLFWMTHQLQPLDEDELSTGLEMVSQAGLPQTEHQPSLEHRELINEETESMENNGNLEHKILKYCHPLVRVLPGISTLGLPGLPPRFDLVHRSLQVCLKRPTEEFSPAMSYHKYFYCDEGQAHKIIGTFCMDYLLLSLFDKAGKRYTEMDREDWLDKVAARVAYQQFVKYAALHWIEHGRVITDAEYERGSREHRLLDPKSEHGLSWFEVWWCLVKLDSGEEFPRQLETSQDLSQCLPKPDSGQIRQMEQHDRKRAQREAADLQSNDEQRTKQVQVREHQQPDREHRNQLRSRESEPDSGQTNHSQFGGRQYAQQDQVNPPQTIPDWVSGVGFQNIGQGGREQASEGQQSTLRQGRSGEEDVRGKAAHQRANRDRNVQEQDTHQRTQQDTRQLNMDHDIHEWNTQKRHKQGQGQGQWKHDISEQLNPDGQQHTVQEPHFQEPDDQEPDDQGPDDQEPYEKEPNDQKPDAQKPNGQGPYNQEPNDQGPHDQEPHDQEPHDQGSHFQEPNIQGPNVQQATQRSGIGRWKLNQQQDRFQANLDESLFGHAGHTGRNTTVHTKPGQLEREPDYSNRGQANQNADRKASTSNADQKEFDQKRHTQGWQSAGRQYLAGQQDTQDRAAQDRGYHTQNQEGFGRQHFTQQQSIQDCGTQDRGWHTQDQQEAERQHLTRQQNAQDRAAQDYLRGPEGTERLVNQRHGGFGQDKADWIVQDRERHSQDQQGSERQHLTRQQDPQNGVARDYLGGPKGAEQQLNQKHGRVGQDKPFGQDIQDIQDWIAQDYVGGPQGAEQQTYQRHGRVGQDNSVGQEDGFRQEIQDPETQRYFGVRRGEAKFANQEDHWKPGIQAHTTQGHAGQRHLNNRQQSTPSQRRVGGRTIQNAAEGSGSEDQVEEQYGSIENPYQNRASQEQNAPGQLKQQVNYRQADRDYGEQDHANQGQVDSQYKYNNAKRATRSPDIQDRLSKHHGTQQDVGVDQGRPIQQGTEGRNMTYLHQQWFNRKGVGGTQGAYQGQATYQQTNRQHFNQRDTQRPEFDHEDILSQDQDQTMEQPRQQGQQQYGSHRNQNNNGHRRFTKPLPLQEDPSSDTRSSSNDINANANTNINTNNITDTDTVTPAPAPKSSWRAATSERTASRWRQEEARGKEEKNAAIRKAIREQMEKRRWEEQEWEEAKRKGEKNAAVRTAAAVEEEQMGKSRREARRWGEAREPEEKNAAIRTAAVEEEQMEKRRREEQQREEARKKKEKNDALRRAVREQMEKRRREEQHWKEIMELKRQAESRRRVLDFGRG